MAEIRTDDECLAALRDLIGAQDGQDVLANAGDDLLDAIVADLDRAARTWGARSFATTNRAVQVAVVSDLATSLSWRDRLADLEISPGRREPRREPSQPHP